MSDTSERKRKLTELLAYAKKTSWRRKSLEKRIGEIVSYLSQTVYWFSVEYSERHKAVTISAYTTFYSQVRMVTILWFVTSNAINKAIVIFLEQLLDDLHDYENTER